MQGAPLSCLWIGPVYFGTSHVENVILRNNSPESCDWVAVLQDTAAGTEMVSVGKVVRHLSGEARTTQCHFIIGQQNITEERMPKKQGQTLCKVIQCHYVKLVANICMN